ncbi:hypothetical protein VHUM_00277 [Vanrija humicola]|uniref:NADAR domain-containing protein n=1 Tax=Vanrija humicola TaxID=5417 RepID=A0A7D8V288_VANHU|nr:hypothetical protein VHUM_00277 [Vanrija humicola]
MPVTRSTSKHTGTALTSPAPAPKPSTRAPGKPRARAPDAEAEAYTFFYGSKGPLAPLSQWYAAAPFADPSYPGKTFATAEHYMMYRKALLFDPGAADGVLAARGPKEAKALGRALRNFDQGAWDGVADAVVERGNYFKFSQNAAAREVLCGTRGTVVEAAPRDRVWGIGFGADNALANKRRWGANRLGLALTRVRERLVAERAGGGVGEEAKDKDDD